MRRAAQPGRCVVIKVGSSSLALPSGGLEQASVHRTVSQVVGAKQAGYRPVLVSSGAVAAGLPSLGLSDRPTDLPGLQAAASVGQTLLMRSYASEFAEHGIVVGQVLLTRDVFANRVQYLHARETLTRLLSINVIPIINENDTVTVDELRLGDNDRLAALVCHLVEADMLVLLTDTFGIFSADPRLNDSAEFVNAVEHNDALLDELYRSSSKGGFGSGGITTKIAAARMAAWSGIPTVVAKATDRDVVDRALRGEEVGTWIAPHQSGLSARKLWIAFGLPPAGEIHIDEGATAAIRTQGRSLLAVGIREAKGEFNAGDAVGVVGPDGTHLAKGLVRMDSGSVRLAAGQHSSVVGGEVIHRDDLVLLA